MCHYFHHRYPTTYEPMGNIGRDSLTRARLCVLPTTVTGVPMWTRPKNMAARSRGIRTHPSDAGCWQLFEGDANRQRRFKRWKYKQRQNATAAYSAANYNRINVTQ